MDTKRDPVLEAAAAMQFARARLGPATEQLLGRPEAQALVVSRIRHGADVEDAVLWLAHREARTDPRVADEFVAFFLAGLTQAAKPALSPGLRRYLDSDDLVQSVMGDLWSELTQLQFETRAEFLAYLAQRVKWKASDHVRGLNRDKRREDLRESADVAEMALRSTERAPDSLAAVDDEWQRLVLVLVRLPERDQQILRQYLRGADVAEIARSMQMEFETARKALQRAMRRARELT